MGKVEKPDSKAPLASKTIDRHYIPVRMPLDLMAAMREAVKVESKIYRHNMSLNEWMVRAIIDRLGELYGAQVARQFYRKYFNGIVALTGPVELPDV